MQTITIEAIENLATTLEETDAAQRLKLRRLICAYARILAAREPHLFERRPTERSDEDGHWDNSFPPKVKLKNHVGPRLIRVSGWTTEDIATSGGFYYDYKTVTTDPGLYVAKDGSVYGANETGTGHFGQFAAHPGDCNVECEIDWDRRSDDELELSDLQAVEAHLRALAFPASQAVAS